MSDVAAADAPDAGAPDALAAVFPGDGEMAARCRALDWAATPLGPPSRWPAALRAGVRLMLGTPIPTSVWVGPDYTLLYNDAYARLLGANHPAALGRPGSLAWAAVWPAFLPRFAVIRAGGPPDAGDEALIPAARRPGGAAEDAWFTYSLSALTDEDGRYLAVYNVAVEVTGRVLAERGLAAERERLRSLVLHLPAPVALHEGPDQRYALLNTGYARVSGRGPEIVGRTPAEAFPELVGTGLFERLAAVYRTGEAWTAPETPVRLDRNGTGPQDAWFDLHFEPVRDAAGRVVGVLNTSVEVTGQVRARQAVERLLAESEAARSALAAANAQLQNQQVELERTNQQLQAQAAELAAQAEALQATAAHLEEQTEATGRARAVAELDRQRLLTTLEQLPVGVVVAEAPSGRLVLTNAAVRRIWGAAAHTEDVPYYSADYVGYRPGAAVPLASHEWPLARALADGETVGGEVVEVARPDGSRVLVSLSAAPVRAAGGEVVGGVMTSTDVTERERLLAAERLAAGRARLLQALTTAFGAALTPEAVVRVVLEHGVPALGATTGLVMFTADNSQAAAEGAALTFAGAQGYPPGFDARFARVPLDAPLPIAEAAREQRPVWVPDLEAARAYPDLPAIYAATGNAATAALPLVGAGGRVIGALAFNYPTARAFDAAGRALKTAVARQCAQALERARLFAAERAARAEAEEARGAAEAANQAKSTFLATMSHELRTPLNAIGGYAQLLDMGLHGPVTSEQRAALARVQAAQTRLLSLINDVLNYAKLEGGRVEYDLRPVDVADVVADVAPLVEPQMRSKGLAFDVHLPEGPCVVWADREKLGQVLVNLLSNAVKFTDSPDPRAGAGRPGRVTVSVATRAVGPDGGRPELTFLRVSDTGRGVPREKQDAIFDPFVQVRTGGSVYAQATEGTGLGLAISRDLARGMGGDLRVRSAEGEGAAFTVTLRRVPTAAGDASA